MTGTTKNSLEVDKCQTKTCAVQIVKKWGFLFSGYNGVSNRYDAGTQGSRLASMYGLNSARKTAGLGLGGGGGLGALDIGE